MDINILLRLMAEKNASDLFFSTGAPPHMKIEGVSTPMGQSPLPPGAIQDIAYNMMNEEQIKEFEEEWEANFAYTVKNIGRFRANVFKQRGEVGMVLRHIKYTIPAMEELRLPPAIPKLVMEPSGLVLICGPTGSGKSTTMAAMIDYRNSRQGGHILTIEDPIEYLHRHKMSILDQREIGVDTRNFHNALKNAMREAPDVIMIGEIRDKEAMEYALSFSQTGHLVIATIHGNNVKQAIDRVRNMFPADNRDQVMMELSTILKGIVAQRLLRNQKGVRVPALEIMIGSPETAEVINKNKLDDLRAVIEKSENDGMQTFDQALYNLWRSKEITREDALHFAESRTDLSLRMRLGNQGANADVTGTQQQRKPDESQRFSTKL
jgi:twitching motility protein PilU